MTKVIDARSTLSLEDLTELYDAGEFFESYAEDDWHDVSLLCYRLAAERGSPEAQNRLGEIYEQGITIGPDMNSAKEWYQRASDRDQ